MGARRLLVVQLDADDPPARLGGWLVDAGLELDVRDLPAGDRLPDDLSDHAGLLVMGGAMGANDDQIAPFLPAVRALLRSAVSGEVPTLGVCLGHQLLAVAHGGRIARAERPEYGAQLVAKRSAAADDPLFRPVPITPDVIQWHIDEVVALPPGAQQLAGSPGTEQQSFRLGRLAWGIQFHIETTPDMVRAWARGDADRLERGGWDAATVVARAVAVHDDLAEVWQPFAAGFAEIVLAPDSVAPSASVPSSSAAPVTDPAAIRAALAAELIASRQPLGMPTMRPPSGPDRD